MVLVFLTSSLVGARPAPADSSYRAVHHTFLPLVARYHSPLSEVEVLTMPPVDVAALLAEDVEREAAGLPPRFAHPIDVQINPATVGTWTSFGNDTRRWRLRIVSPGAVSLNLGFSRYTMPPGGRLLVYTPDQRASIGPFTASDNDAHGQLWTSILPGDEIVLDLTIPAGAVPLLALNLASVNHGYVDLGRAIAPESGACNVDVVCPEGDLWREEIRSVAVYSVGGSSVCSGALINNTAQDLTPYFLTAHHCDVTTANASTVVVYWNYENSTCRPPGSAESGNPGDGSLAQNQTGAIVRADYADTDFTLLELDDPVDPAFNAHWAGWDWSGVDATSAVAIHHPRGDEKRISFENDATSVTSYYGTSVPGDGTHIRVTDWDLGTTEPGSSGSPLFDQNHRIIGQLHGGDAACGNDESDWYGRLARSWTGGGSAATQLMDWLDPLKTGAATLDGTDIVADLSIEKTDSTDPVAAGEDLVYTITVTNDGPHAAGDVTVTDTLPPEVSYFWSTAGCIENPVGTLTCDLGEIAAGGSTTFEVTVIVPEDLVYNAGGPVMLSNAVEVTSANSDPDLTNNTAAEDTEVIAEADLEVTKSDMPDPVAAGAPLTYTIQVTNYGPSGPTDVHLLDVLPDGVTYVSDDGGCTPGAMNTLDCDLTAMEVGETREVMVHTLVDADLVYNAGGPTTITNTVTVESLDSTDPDPANNVAVAETLVIAVADLEIVSFEAVDPPSQVLIGEPVEIVLHKVIDNNGPSAPMDVWVMAEAVVPPDIDVTPSVMNWMEPALGLDENRLLEERFVIQCNGPSHHVITFTNEIMPYNVEDTDPDLSNNTASIVLDIECVVPVAVNIKPGSYPNSINVRNHGVIPLAVLTTMAGEYGTPIDFDATTIDPLSVRFGPRDIIWNDLGGAYEEHERGHIEDAIELDEFTMDGDMDMVLHFATQESELMIGLTEACVKGDWVDADGVTHTFFGCDSVRLLGPPVPIR
jgi:uncharacterized repeat protein (TIGR01451 family)